MLRKEEERFLFYIFYRIEKILPALFFILFLLPVSLQAKVSGVCSNCHTMHNSQGGSAVAQDFDGSSFSTTATPKRDLLIYSCLGCHSATDATTWKDTFTGAPIVFNTVEPTYNAEKGLAGGNFYWVKSGLGNDDTKGHNVFLGEPDANLLNAPGSTITCGNPATNCHANLSESEPTMGTRQGCTKCHMMKNDYFRYHHHADDSNTVVGTENGDSDSFYRFLQGHMSGVLKGVSGIEDDDWEFETSTDHNEYLGNPGTKNAQMISPMAIMGNTMTAFCCGCHGNFHWESGVAAGASPWIRHPSDSILPNSGEYSAYTTYDPLVPVARPDLSGYTGSSNTINPGTDLLMCLSCHRAHASPYFKMMRWDYRGWPGNSGTSGCNRCHTSKD